MRLLLDAHVLIWAVDDTARLGTVARTHVEDIANDLLISAATIWELAIKISLNKLTLSQPYEKWVAAAIGDLGAILLPITLAHCVEASKLPWHHRDPFDRLLVAQAEVEGVPLVSSDAQFDQYGISRLW